ncbi:hypothetical protein DFQ28_004177 [Apophysomyces sp. BC1034]|nr:hypothetical protein DFQ30_006002 [Apophysomyces sp. BC1015]KAG0177596.1 hypothetical protein DFQ29_004648 [Apophysomyces sp. BC1021]KAG0188899.1 hypothetical protein DFQ28_004177 [Apophysomyces sp. BC1034]
MAILRLLFLGVALLNALVLANTFTPHDLVSFPRPGAVSPSPNGRLAVYAQSAYNSEKDKTTKSLYLIDLKESAVKELTKPGFDVSYDEPFFLDDTHVAYVYHHKKESVDQIYVLDIENDFHYRLTDLPVAFGNIKYNAKNRLLAFSAAVYDDGKLERAVEKDRKLAAKKDSALVYDHLMVRHWDTFISEKKNNLFTIELELQDGRYRVASQPRNLLKRTGLMKQSPNFPLGDSSDYAISADGSQLAFVSKIQTPDNAWQTSQHIYLVQTTEHSDPIPVNDFIPAASSKPTFAPNGILAYLQMVKPQYEADRNRIVIFNPKTRARRLLVEDWDRSPSELAFSPDSSTLYVVAEDHGRSKIFAINLVTEDITMLTDKHVVSGLSVLSSDTLLFNVNSMNHPNIAHTLHISSGELVQQGPSDVLRQHLDNIDLQKPEEFEFDGSLNHRVHGWLVKPADFDPSEKYPVAFLIHGGPQSAWSDSWSTRWNPQVFANAGYVVVAINPHGSTGYGQEFCDAIQRNWGSYPFWDLEKGLDYVLSTYDFLDSERVVGLGASYGGYMINWINGHSNRFRALVNHDGMFSTVNTYYTTDELYFPEREFGGTPFHPLTRLTYERWSPSNFVQHWKTPTLVIHGGHDYRLVDGEALATFTALQRQGIPSRFVYFPDESHWVLKPANSLRWHKEGKYKMWFLWAELTAMLVIEWIDQWTAVPEKSEAAFVVQHQGI